MKICKAAATASFTRFPVPIAQVFLAEPSQPHSEADSKNLTFLRDTLTIPTIAVEVRIGNWTTTLVPTSKFAQALEA